MQPEQTHGREEALLTRPNEQVKTEEVFPREKGFLSPRAVGWIL